MDESGSNAPDPSSTSASTDSASSKKTATSKQCECYVNLRIMDIITLE